MFDADDGRSGFVKSLSWMGPPPYPLGIYVVCVHAMESLFDEIKAFWPPNAEFFFFRLADDWPFEIAFFEIRLQELTRSLDDNIKLALESVVTMHNTPAVFMFAGAFNDYRHLFKAEQQSHVFGLCVPDRPAIVCTRDAERHSLKLAEELRRARTWLVENYPQIDNSYSKGEQV